MAVFGTLDKVSIADILILLQRRSGVLTITGSEVCFSSELYLDSGELRGLELDYRSVDNPESIRQHIAQLMGATSGRFHFVEGVLPVTQRLALPIRKLVLEAKFEVIKTRQNDAELPHPQTRFRSTFATSESLPPALWDFYQRAESRFALGVSAEELARDLGLELRGVQLKLQQLRMLNLIMPVRAYHNPRGDQTPVLQRRDEPHPAATPARNASLLRRLIHVLRQL